MKKEKKSGFWSKLADVLTFLVLLISIFMAVSAVATRSTGVASIFGTSLFSVQTESMTPTFRTGDLIAGKRVSSDAKLSEGDIITYWTLLEGQRTLNTHRIVEVQQVGNGVYYITKGDNPAASVDANAVSSYDVVAKYNGFRIPGGGRVYDFLTSQKGFFLCILLPMLILFFYQIFRFVQDYKAFLLEQAHNRKKAPELSEEEKRAIAEAYLAQQNKADIETKKDDTES